MDYSVVSALYTSYLNKPYGYYTPAAYSDRLSIYGSIYPDSFVNKYGDPINCILMPVWMSAWFSRTKIEDYLKNNLSIYSGKVDNVVLGCTHYPLIQKQIAQVLGDVKFFNGAPNLAKHLKDVLIEKNLLDTTYNNGKIEFIDDSNSEYKKERFFKYLN